MAIEWLIVAIVVVIIGVLLAMLGQKDRVKWVGATITVFGLIALVAVLFAAPVSTGGDFFRTGDDGVSATAVVEGGQIDDALLVGDGSGKLKNGTYYPIDTLTMQLQEAFSNSYSAADGTVNVYKLLDEDGARTDPASANVNPIATFTITDGNGSYTGKLLTTDTAYRVVIDDAADTYYTVDLGEIYFSSQGVVGDNVDILYQVEQKSRKVATFGTLLDATASLSGDGDTNTVGNDFNELVTNGSGGVIYDVSAGDESVTVRIVIDVDGADSISDNTVLYFRHDATNEPEGTEVSSISAELVSGTGIPAMTNLNENNWKDETPISLGDLRGGTKVTYDLVFTLDEGSINAGADDFYVGVDDLGGWKNKDLLNNAKATLNEFLFDTQA